MEVRIRLQKIGRASKASNNYRVVAMSKASARDAKHLEIIGHYNPTRQPEEFVVDHEKLQKWIDNGAQMSETVKSLLKREKKANK